MRSLASIPRPVLLAMATLFAAATVFYAAAWMYYIGWQPPVEIGVELGPLQPRGYLQIARVTPNTPAAQAGLEAGDRILEVNGQPLSGLTLPDPVARGKPGDMISLLIERPGTGLIRASLALIPYQRPSGFTSSQRVMNSILRLYPVLFLVVGLAVLFLRLDDRNAWLLAIMFAGFIAAAPLAFLEGAISLPLRRFLFAYMIMFYGCLPAIFYYFFATFPASSPINRRMPWLKTVLLVGGGAVALACSLVVLAGGGMYSLIFAVLRPVPGKLVLIVTSIYSFGGFILGLVSLVGNDISAPTSDARRKTRVMVVGTVLGSAPVLVLKMRTVYPGRQPTDISYWFAALAIMALFLIPLSFAYAVVKHRVLEIPVLLRRSARYVLVQRGFVLLLFVVAAGVTALFTRFFSRFFETGSNAGMVASVALGVVMVWSFAPVIRRGTERIDKAFFRSTYDARLILQDLAEKTRSVADRQELAALLQNQIKDALHPKTLACFFRREDGELVQESGFPDDVSMTIPDNHPIVQESANRGRSWDVVPSGTIGSEDTGELRNLAPECLVPILGRGGRLIGLLALGERLSEEPYSREDKRLLDSVASQAGMALENIHLAEEMAARLEAEHRANQEMEFARQVQSRLFPQKVPPLETLEYSGTCIQARQVGGDYYDFLELHPGRVALVLADIAGKGISGALLMANLQANLRSQYAMALSDLTQLLVSANRLFYQNTGDSSYATLFFADYDDRSQRLRYVNCGHLPPLLVRGCAAGKQNHVPVVERLQSTATVMGLFEPWECGIAEIDMHPGDILVMYTDGVTEASNSADEEFGEQRLVQVIASNRSLPVSDIQQHIVAAVQQFSGSEQADDITLVVARCRHK